MTYLAPPMREPAFKIDPDPRFIYLDVARRRLLTELIGHAESGFGLAVLEGEPGLGKTILLRQLEQEAALHALPLVRPLVDAGKADVGELLDSLSPARQERSVLLLDDADRLSVGVWRKMLALVRSSAGRSQAVDEVPPLVVVLSAIPDVGEWLTSLALASPAACVYRFRLAPFAARDAALYIRHRLKAARGADGDPFSAEAIERIVGASGGVPLQINRLCSTAMAIAQLRGEANITAATVDRAIDEHARSTPESFAGSGTGVGADAGRASAPECRSVPPSAVDPDWQAYRAQLAAFHNGAAEPTLSGLADRPAPSPLRRADPGMPRRAAVDAQAAPRLPIGRPARRLWGMRILAGSGFALAGAIGAMLLLPTGGQELSTPPPLGPVKNGGRPATSAEVPLASPSPLAGTTEPAPGGSPIADTAPPLWLSPEVPPSSATPAQPSQWPADDIPPSALPTPPASGPDTGMPATPARERTAPSASASVARTDLAPGDAKHPGSAPLVRPSAARAQPATTPAPRPDPAPAPRAAEARTPQPRAQAAREAPLPHPAPTAAQEAPSPDPVGGDAEGAEPADPSRPRPLREILAIGDDFRESGDLDYARRFYRAALDRGSARAATAIGETYDPQRVAASSRPDATEARWWYTRAAEMGDREAARRLGELDAWAEEREAR